jgi:hypothetical protein
LETFMSYRLWMMCIGTATFALPALAQKVAPGLWETTLTMKMQGPQMDAAMAQMQEHLAKLTPEQRQQMEAMMAGRGVQPGVAGGVGVGTGLGLMAGKPTVVKSCITSEMAAREELPQSQGNCRQVSKERSGNTLKFKYTCTGESTSSAEGQFTLISDKAYSGRMVMEGVTRGQPHKMDVEQQARWLGADCGDVKPPQLPTTPR